MRGAPIGPVAVLLAALLLGGCGDGESEEATDTASASPSEGSPGAVSVDELDGSIYQSTSVEGHELVPRTRVSISFKAGSMSVVAGCNTLFGDYEVEDGTLRWTAEPASTMRGCPDDLAAQDAWLVELLDAGVAATLDGTVLTLTGDGVTITLEHS
ncbi:META domain-containing protein [Nocardioides sp. GY 10113]|uniref:META domain-containing protein n=1 Tax=Nocardioides sp. GY 10113 TaxID=2569761 RepID=UPI0010A7CE54|nr:META domain-containing protein [Nocardioides sp. GY 10113]TIC88781.1 META domain-containing protein [Nocardioides sp. GY 10113]